MTLIWICSQLIKQKLLQIYNLDNIPNNRVKKWYKIAEIYGISYIIITCSLTTGFAFWMCATLEFRVDELVQLMSVALYCCQQIINYASLIAQNRRISAIVDRMHEIVNKRKCSTNCNPRFVIVCMIKF